MRSVLKWQWLVVAALTSAVLTAQAYTYNDIADGAWVSAATWSSSDGGTTYPQAGDTAVIDSNTVSMPANPAGTIYLNSGGKMNVGWCNLVTAALHLNGGTMVMGAGSWFGASTLDVYVDSDSVITNSATGDWQGMGIGTCKLVGNATLTVFNNIIGVSSDTFTISADAAASTYSGLWRIINGKVRFPSMPAAGTAGWANSTVDVVNANSGFTIGGTSWGESDLITNVTMTGRGGLFSFNYANQIHFTNAAVVSPGTCGTDDAGTLALCAGEQYDTIYFDNGSEYRCNITGIGTGDKIDTGQAPVNINPGAKLTLKFWTPTANVPSLSADILTTTNIVDTDTFTTNVIAAKGWSNLKVNYERTTYPRRVYVTGAYTTPPPLGTTVLFR